MSCEHKASSHRYDDTCAVNRGQGWQPVYRCVLCKELIIRPNPWEDFITFKEFKKMEINHANAQYT